MVLTPSLFCLQVEARSRLLTPTVNLVLLVFIQGLQDS